MLLDVMMKHGMITVNCACIHKHAMLLSRLLMQLM